MDLLIWPQLRMLHSDQKIDINSTPFSLGRSLNCNHVITSKLVSRVHCVFSKTDDGWIVTDKSTNGTVLNGNVLKGVDSLPLKNGDTITLTASPYIYRYYAQPVVELDISDEQLCNLADIVESQAFEGVESNKRESEDGDSNLKKKRSLEPIKDDNIEPVSVKLEEDKKEDINTMQNHMETVEDELTCSICSELFIKAVTLNCSHSFCKYCIEMWQKNKSICPICREKITRVNPTLVLNNFISKVLENSTDEIKERRKRLISERTKEEEKANSVRSGNSRRRRNNTRIGGGTVLRVATSTATVVHNAGPVVIELSDNETDEEDPEDDSSYFDDSDIEIEMHDWEDEYLRDDWYEIRSRYGSGGEYYGGYGACYSCGERGHWANGCPNRNRRRH